MGLACGITCGASSDIAAAPLEMANLALCAAVRRLYAALLAGAFTKAFGSAFSDDALTAGSGLLAALDVFQRESGKFYPCPSKYNAYLRGETELNGHRLRWLALFNDESRDNCASRHPGARQREGLPQFADRSDYPGTLKTSTHS